jgi:hypothetical protein
MDHRPVDHRFAALGERLIVLAQPATAAEPRERSFYNPPLGQDDESRDAAKTFDNLQSPPAELGRPAYQLAGVTTIGPDDLEAGKQSTNLPQHELGSVAVLDVGGVHDDTQYQTEHIDHDVSLSALDFLARVVPAVPPFSTVFTDWLSMIAAVGVGFRPAPTRTCSRRAS